MMLQGFIFLLVLMLYSKVSWTENTPQYISPDLRVAVQWLFTALVRFHWASFQCPFSGLKIWNLLFESVQLVISEEYISKELHCTKLLYLNWWQKSTSWTTCRDWKINIWGFTSLFSWSNTAHCKLNLCFYFYQVILNHDWNKEK